ncbi:hypothetical protein CDAR_296291 [Caerostris darwini]|uniref:Uncharacterized protein n=1 Tax=Caerostris darwini TaxID=1538125 RepID=A0AAV4USJ6_9ARAC|nr:hypothetical protein CDAR_296291 [Caerostris darwini]
MLFRAWSEYFWEEKREHSDGGRREDFTGVGEELRDLFSFLSTFESSKFDSSAMVTVGRTSGCFFNKASKEKKNGIHPFKVIQKMAHDIRSSFCGSFV